MDDDDFVTQYTVNVDPPDEPAWPKQPKGCFGWLWAILVLLGLTLLYCIL